MLKGCVGSPQLQMVTVGNMAASAEAAQQPTCTQPRRRARALARTASEGRLRAALARVMDLEDRLKEAESQLAALQEEKGELATRMAITMPAVGPELLLQDSPVTFLEKARRRRPSPGAVYGRCVWGRRIGRRRGWRR